MWRIEFESEKFLPFLPEDSQVNPGVYGFELATWLSQALAKREVITSYPGEEDWGWFLEYFVDELEVLIGCSSMCSEERGNDGPAVSWSIFVDPRRTLKQKLKGVDANGPTELLAKHITELLESEGIRWRTA